MTRRQITHLGAPIAFLVAVTVVVLLVRSGLEGGATTGRTITFRPTNNVSTVTQTRSSTTAGASTGSAVGRYYTVQKGDTFGAIAQREGTTIAKLEALNPGVNPTTLQVGQKIRTK